MIPRISFEVFPPKTADGLAGLDDTIQRLATVDPTYVSVTYGAGGSSRDRSFAAIERVAAARLPIAGHLTCVAQPTVDVDAVIDRYAELGVGRIVALRGDPPEGIDAPYRAHHAGYRTTADLVRAVSTRGDFDIAVSAYPERHPQSPTDDHDLDVLAAKVDAGATSAITQMFFDNELFEHYRDRVDARGIDVELVPGIFPIHGLAAVRRFAERCGASFPDWIADRFAGAEEGTDAARQVAADLAAEQIDELGRMGVAQVHVYTLNRAELALAVCDRLAVAA